MPIGSEREGTLVMPRIFISYARRDLEQPGIAAPKRKVDATSRAPILNGNLPSQVQCPSQMESRETMRPDANRCLLLIDDEPAQRRLVTAIGARAGWWVMGATDIEAAQNLLDSEEGKEVDAILLDK